MFFWRKSLSYQEPIEKLAFNMLTHFSSDKENIVVSPYSTFSVLLMSTAIFKESTRRQNFEALGIPTNTSVKDLLTALNQLIKTIEVQSSDGNVSGANSIWPNKNSNFDPSLYAPLEQYLGAKITPVEFPQPGCDLINKHIEEVTHGLIKNMLNPLLTDKLTHSLIVNAIYFNAKWKKPFESKNTNEETFTLLDGTEVKTKLMQKKDEYLYGEDENAKILSMEYINDYSMVCILPKLNSAESFRAVRTALANGKYKDYLKMLSPKPIEVDVKIPKFKHYWGTSSLTKMLNDMGIKDMFNPTIELHFVDDIVQKAVIEVDEVKTEAAAVTISFIKAGALFDFNKPMPPSFHADHPFFYFITHKEGTILFAGEYIKPE
ncbi:serpin family protein [Histomonas meleagridis]|uniref:serpin family protein n=1 Tax=Histomonas meleagridis TaxID=135588 RepID=UPI00355A8046|nr:serpin family protein [Histomonas meleagridis]KAH0797518.1 serpin family protein [Histomonas meleagridis]